MYNNVRDSFTPRVLNEEDKLRMDDIREEFIRLAEMINVDVHDSREKALALTKLKEAHMWVNEAISRELKPMRYHD